MRRLFLTLLSVVAVAFPPAALARPAPHVRSHDAVFALPGDRVLEAAIVCPAASAPDPGSESSPMIDALRGVIATMPPRDVLKLAQAVTNKGLGPDRVPEPRARFDIVLRGAQSNKRIRLYEGSDGLLFAAVAPLPAPGAPETAETRTAGAVMLDREEVRALAEASGWSWHRFAGTFEVAPPTIGEVFELAPPFEPGAFLVDKKLLSDRLLGGRSTQLRRSDRNLNKERFWCRLPAGYSHQSPAGVVVWIDAADDGRPPAAVHEALDRLNLIAVGAANSGNQRHISDRLQLAFDALATIQVRYHTDPARVYISGLSGGARVATIIQACFADVFTGAVGVVGAAHYEQIRLPGVGLANPNYARPVGKLWAALRTRRIAAITGERDFGYLQIQTALQMMGADGLQTKLFQYPDMGHSLPTPARFLDALKWIDEPATFANADRAKAADRALAPVRERISRGKPLTPPMRTELARLTRDYPWTPAAWKACEMLGVTKRTPSRDHTPAPLTRSP